MDFRFDIIYEYRWMFFYGVLATLGITVVATAGGSILGLLLALARLINPEKAGVPMRALAWVLRKISFWYVALFRGTPLLAQVIIWAFVIFPFFVHPTDGALISGEAAINFRRSYGPLIAGVMALIANSGAYVCEIFRAGIQSIDKGQMEAARSLGLTYTQAMRYVILPQALRRMLPPLAGEFITLLKDSSLLSVIAVPELMSVQKAITGQYSIFQEPLYTVALIYLVLTSVLGWVFLRLERRYNVKHH
ncbi:amino acid ABC transporter permease [Neisseria sp. HMSC069H12]|uniref:amino acid ABC transporter permease n=1 Tax=Neisseria sp. HMSC069H12 TaxID=1739376 RepID=UPI0008A4FC9C|nr:amino acid ABC transporter permease [Neisseria sp. HMSC069H12]OFR69483.1 amino acid ABC transporter permease [Neisseria sp. HMSC069H12]